MQKPAKHLLREPSPKMIEEGMVELRASHGQILDEVMITNIWRRMHDAAPTD